MGPQLCHYSNRRWWKGRNRACDRVHTGTSMMWVLSAYVCVLSLYQNLWLPRHFIYCIYVLLSDSSVYTKPVYFRPCYGIIPELQQRSPLYGLSSLLYLPHISDLVIICVIDEIWEAFCFSRRKIQLHVGFCCFISGALRDIRLNQYFLIKWL